MDQRYVAHHCPVQELGEVEHLNVEICKAPVLNPDKNLNSLIHGSYGTLFCVIIYAGFKKAV